jgi:hypothetical protein
VCLTCEELVGVLTGDDGVDLLVFQSFFNKRIYLSTQGMKYPLPLYIKGSKIFLKTKIL